jgi:hypothetical protein
MPRYGQHAPRGLSILSGFRAWGALIALAISGTVVIGCGGGTETPAGDSSPAGNDSGQPQIADIPEIEIPAAWAYGDAEDLRTLTASADVVFRGKVVALKDQHPAIPQPTGAGATGPAPRWADFPISQFEVRVEKVVKGAVNPGTSVTFEQTGGVQTRPDGTQVRLILEQDELLQVGEKYLFFAKVREDGVLEAAPFARMKVGGDGRLSAGKGWDQLKALEQLSRMNVDSAEREISAAAAP